MKYSRNAISMLLAKYRAVVRKTWWKNRAYDVTLLRCRKRVTTAALLVSLVVSPGLAAAERWTYTGLSDPHLQNVPDFAANSFAPLGLNDTANNDFTITGPPSFVFGAYSTDGLVTNNTVTIGGFVNKSIYGGYSGNSTAANNNVIIRAWVINGDVYGGYSNAAGAATNNTVTISEGGNINGDVYGGYSNDTGAATNNTVTISGDVGINDVYGGHSAIGNAYYNTVTISDGTVWDEVYGGYSNATGNADANAVTISGGNVRGDVYGGHSAIGNAYDNAVTISGGNVRGNVYGGSAGAGIGVASGNTVTISGSPTLSASVIYGGVGGASSGNTLNVKSAGMSAQGVANFQCYNFYLPTTLANGGAMLTVTDAADISNAAIGVGINGSTTALHAGDRVTLLSTGGLNATGINSRAVGLQGIARIYDFDLTTDVNNLYATVVGSSGPRLNPQTKALSEGQISSAAFLNQGADLLTGQGLQNARSAAAGAAGQFASFAAMGGSSLRYMTGSHIDVNGFSIVAGAANQKTTDQGSNINSLFMENGWGSYNTYNDFVNASSVKGDGNTRYLGAGWLGRWQKNSGQYMEGSFRTGRVYNNFHSSDIGIAGTNSSFDISAPYYGIHVGFGQEKDLGNNYKRDIYTKLLWMHENGSSATVQGDAFDFDAVNSQRWQLGCKWLRKINERTTLRTGLAYQYEFGGKANATVNGVAIDAPSLKGGTDILEVGLTQESKDRKGAKLDFALQGFCGKMRGIAGNIQATWNF